MQSYYVDVLSVLKERGGYTVYWIFWGYELYRPLGDSGKMKLIDNASFFNPMSYIQPTKYSRILWGGVFRYKGMENVLKDFLKYTDFFCTWMYEDYELLQKYYPSQTKFKFFQYRARKHGEDTKNYLTGRFLKKNPHTIMVNHQASMTGNHSTLLKKLKSFRGIENYDIYAPLSYGQRTTRRFVTWKGKRYFKDRFHTITQYMPRSKYFETVGKFEVALFGQLRQEASGNISLLLANGTKVFMRESSTLYQHYKNQGYLVYSFEHDLNSVDDLKGLSDDEKQHNVKVALDNVKYFDDFMPALLTD